ncbi:MAG: sulfite exporter TauE/SafE family protein [Alphaproteobacteria bacterium]|nr:sulfite exporter TauE/SafE family protein [Alphaproteobacteria bacterium]
MVHVYLPIAGVSVDVVLILVVGAGVGFLSGVFGVGGGFLSTPLLIFLGVPSDVAVATQADQLVGSSVSGVLAHWQRGNVDLRMGSVLLVGGLAGSALGVAAFSLLRQWGHFDLVVAILYVIFLGLIAGMMLTESLSTILRRTRAVAARSRLHTHSWLHGLPLRMRFPRSRLYISAILPLGLGFVVGVLVAIMGVGGGFIMVPAMIYLLGMPSRMVAGTSLFQIIFVTAATTWMQAITTQTVDIYLSVLLLVGGVVGAQFGARYAHRLRPEYGRLGLAIVVLLVCAKVAIDLGVSPNDVYSIETDSP